MTSNFAAVVAALGGLGFTRTMCDIFSEATFTDIRNAVKYVCDHADDPRLKQALIVLMMMLEKFGYGVEGFVADETFGPKAVESLRAFEAAAIIELANQSVK